MANRRAVDLREVWARTPVGWRVAILGAGAIIGVYEAASNRVVDDQGWLTALVDAAFVAGVIVVGVLVLRDRVRARRDTDDHPVPAAPPAGRPRSGAGRQPFRWWHLTVFLVPLAGIVYISVFWSPGHDPIVGAETGPFFVGTILELDRFSLEDPDATEDASEAVLAAVCHNYGDWLDDVTLNPDLIVLTPDEGLLRSAELLNGEFDPTPAVLEAERLAVTGLDSEAVLDRMRADDWGSADLADAGRYLDARNTAPSPDAESRYVFYLANVTTKSVVLGRLEVDLELEIRDRPFLNRIGDIAVQLPNDTTIGVNESRCWT